MLTCAGILLLAAIIVSVALGAVYVPVTTTARIIVNRIPLIGRLVSTTWTETQETIILTVRLPRVLLAMLVGMGLAAAGAIFQALFRNPMADPSIISSSQGAALGATIAFYFGIQLKWGGLSAIPVFAFVGAVIAVVVVYMAARTGGRVSVSSLLLIGIAMSTFLSSIVSMLMVINKNGMHAILFWLMGGLGGSSWNLVAAVLPFILIGGVLSMIFSRDLNLVSLGEERAAQLGLGVERFKWIMIGISSMLVGASVAVAGIIGFIGLITPHMVRLMTGPDHRYLIPGSLIGGGLLLVVADTLARTIIAPEELPVGIVTAFFGAPFFIYLIKTRGKIAERVY